jgi:fluoroquinolone resistance protein
MEPIDQPEVLRRLAAEQFFRDVTFEGIDAHGVDLSGKEFLDCRFLRLKLQGCVVREARFENCCFEDCDLTRTALRGARFVDARFVGCKLMGVDFTDVGRNPEVSFTACDLRYASFVDNNLRKITFRDCKACEANFIGCDLKEADFAGDGLSGANFENNDASKASFATANGLFLSPAKNRVKEARIPVESAVLLAMSSGMQVVGYGTTKKASTGRARKTP